MSPRVRLLSVAPLLVLLSCHAGEAERTAAMMTGGDPARGRLAIASYGCNGCHSVPGVPGPKGWVGPPLDRMGRRAYIAGHLPNTPENLVRWIRHPQQVHSGTVMQDLGVTERDGRDIAAYLYTLR